MKSWGKEVPHPYLQPANDPGYPHVAQQERIHLLMQEMQETQVRSLGQEEPLEKEMAAHSSILAWRIPWTEEPGRLQSMGSQRVRPDWATEHAHTLWFHQKPQCMGMTCMDKGWAGSTCVSLACESCTLQEGFTSALKGWFFLLSCPVRLRGKADKKRTRATQFR